MKTGHFYLKLTVLGTLALIVIGYAIYQSRNIISGAELTIESPKNGETLTSELVEIQGIALNISRITLNDRQIFTDESGFFKEKLLLASGYNIFKVEIEDKFKKKRSETLELIYTPPASKNASSSSPSLIQ